MRILRIIKASLRIAYLTLVFPFAVILNVIGLRLWRHRYKKMYYESRRNFENVINSTEME